MHKLEQVAPGGLYFSDFYSHMLCFISFVQMRYRTCTVLIS